MAGHADLAPAPASSGVTPARRGPRPPPSPRSIAHLRSLSCPPNSLFLATKEGQDRGCSPGAATKEVRLASAGVYGSNGLARAATRGGFWQRRLSATADCGVAEQANRINPNRALPLLWPNDPVEVFLPHPTPTHASFYLLPQAPVDPEAPHLSVERVWCLPL